MAHRTTNTATLAALAAVVLASSGARAAIVLDAESSGTVTSSTTLTFSHTIGGGSDRLLVVCVEVEESAGDEDIADVTYNGVSMTNAIGNKVGSSLIMNTEIWFMLDAALPPAGVYDVVVSVPNVTAGDITAGAISVTGAAQAAPEATGAGDDNETGAGSVQASLTTLTDGAWVLDSVGSGNALTGFTADSGQTKSFDVVAGSSRGAGGWEEIASAGLETHQWSANSSSNRLSMVMAAFAPSGGAPSAESWLATGTYTGNGVPSRPITGVGFQPDMVIVKRYPKVMGEVRTSTMPAGVSKQMPSSNAAWSNRIESLDTDGFTVGTAWGVNVSGEPYYWIALKEVAGLLKVGTYTGDAVNDRSITGVGFQPDYVMIFPEGAHDCVHRMSSMSGDATLRFDATGYSTGRIKALESDGFQLGTDGTVNASGDTYHYAAFKSTAGRVATGTYAGDGADDRAVTVGFSPEWVIVDSDSTVTSQDGTPGPMQRTSAVSGDASLNFSWANTTTVFDNCIQALSVSGFQVGSDSVVNGPTSDYYWMAFSDTLPAAGTSPRIVRWVEVDPYH